MTRTRRAGALVGIGSWCARRRLPVVGVWIALLVAATIAGHRLGGSYSDTLTIPGSSAEHGLAVLRAHQPRAGGQSGQVVYSVATGTLRPRRSAIASSVHALGELPHVLSVSDPLSAATTSTNGRTAYASIHFDVNPQSLGTGYVASVRRATVPARSAGVSVSYGGQLGQAVSKRRGDGRSEAIGIALALIVLLIGFGSLAAAGLPLISAGIAVVTGVGVLRLLAASISFGTAAPTLATMMGLGVGIDYALFLTTRHRQKLRDGDTPPGAVRATLAGSGRSVLIAAMAVVIAMLGLYASGISFIGKLGLAAAITVAVSALAALTLVPALLSALGGRIDRLRVRRPVAEPTPDDDHSAMRRYTMRLERHPWRWALGGIAALLVIAIPALSMQLGHVGASAEPRSNTQRQAYDAISSGFGAGANGPITIVVALPSGDTAARTSALATSLSRALRATPGVASAAGATRSRDGALLVDQVIAVDGPTSRPTASLVRHLQDVTLPHALAGTGATGDVSGTTAAAVDFQETVSSRLPVIIAVVIGAAFLLLLAAFRSPVLALKAALLNLLSIGAAYGVVVAVFQWDWGGPALGIEGHVSIESYVPMMMFAIVFGLSMDYEVFLLSRIREHWVRTGDDRESVAVGLGQTARVITCAALIMASVFFAFLLSSNPTVKMLAVGLGVSVLIDATVIRLLVVPSLMFVFGRANWWVPGWLDRWLPHLEPREPEPAPRASVADRGGAAPA